MGGTRLVLIEGLPGSGKTSLAERLAGRLADAGTPAAWWDEIEADHPATPRSLLRTASAPGYAERCLEHWRRFARKAAHRARLPILEAAPFQSTIRFMLEYEHERSDILGYVERFDRTLAELSPTLFHLRPPEPRRHLEEFVYPLRGEAWVEKVAGYLTSRPWCVRRGLTGVDGMTEFWLRYRDLCDEAAAALHMRVVTLEAGQDRFERCEAGAFRRLSPTTA